LIKKGEIAFKSMNVDLSASIACAAQTFYIRKFLAGNETARKNRNNTTSTDKKIISFV